MVITKSQLKIEYLIKKKTCRQIAKIYKVSHVTILSYLKKYSIKTRNKHKAQIGKKLSNKTKKKMSLAKIGKPSPFKGIKGRYSKKTIEKFRKNLKGKTGRFSRNWQGGKSFEPYSVEFNKSLKEKIRKRDNYICQNCEITEKEHLKVYGQVLHVHHIDYNKQNCKTSNLISVCLPCNSKANSNRDTWKIFYANKISKEEREWQLN